MLHTCIIKPVNRRFRCHRTTPCQRYPEVSVAARDRHIASKENARGRVGHISHSLQPQRRSCCKTLCHLQTLEARLSLPQTLTSFATSSHTPTTEQARQPAQTSAGETRLPQGLTNLGVCCVAPVFPVHVTRMCIQFPAFKVPLRGHRQGIDLFWHQVRSQPICSSSSTVNRRFSV